MDVAAGAQGLPHQRTLAEGGGDGGDDDPACHHQGGQQAAVRQRLTAGYGFTSSSLQDCTEGVDEFIVHW